MLQQEEVVTLLTPSLKGLKCPRRDLCLLPVLGSAQGLLCPELLECGVFPHVGCQWHGMFGAAGSVEPWALLLPATLPGKQPAQDEGLILSPNSSLPHSPPHLLGYP